MTYIVLARKYRPQGFDQVIGQETISVTLKNAIKMERVHHAFLFGGPRGVGKTSMARIFAKALNCRKGEVGEPCGKCASCVDITGGHSLDVIEIDGASTRGIDDIREIRESIKFSPSYGKYKIYIIDEVHQITSDGFNALLKTLEEPPKHAKFIFATTSPQKIPLTILSRCQRYDFKRIATPVIAEALGHIAKKEGIKIAPEALTEIAKAADGSLRDAQSMLDQISSFSKDKITSEHVYQSLGIFHAEIFFKLFDHVASQNAEEVLRVIDRIEEEGKDAVFFLEKCLEHMRNLMVVKIADRLSDLIEGSDDYREGVKRQAGQFSKADLFYFFSLLVQGIQNVKRFNTKRTAMEMALIKCTLREPMIQLDQVAQVPKGTTAIIKNAVHSDVREESSKSLDELWVQLLRKVRAEKISAATYLEEAQPVGIEGDKVIIGFLAEHSFHADALRSEANMSLVAKHLSELLQRTVYVEYRLIDEENANPNAGNSPRPVSQKETTPPSVKTAIGIFGGRVLKKN